MTSPSQNQFYVTLLSNVLQKIYEQNKNADFTVKLAHPADLRLTPNCEEGFCEISFSASPEVLTPFYFTVT